MRHLSSAFIVEPSWSSFRPAWYCLGAPLSSPGAPLGPSWAVLRPCWPSAELAVLGPSWAVEGSSLSVRLGSFRRPSWASFGSLGAVPGLEAPLGSLEAIGSFLGLLGSSWRPLGPSQLTEARTGEGANNFQIMSLARPRLGESSPSE